MSIDERPIRRKRIGLVIGIDKYEDESIPLLRGAIHDAEEIFKILTENGEFERDNKYLLLGESATRKNILTLISEIFRENNDCEFALFYFSGHGFVDNRQDLFISTYDMVKKDPFINGIRVNELKEEIYSSKDKEKALLILDCCYSGTATQGARGEINSKNIIAAQKKIIGETKIPTSQYGVGKITIASTESKLESWEKKLQHNPDDPNDIPHYHGVFSYHLIEGLKGKAANDLGYVTLSSLLRYISDNMREQESFYSMTESSNIEKIWFTKSQEIIEQAKQITLDDIKLYIERLNDNFPDFVYIKTVSDKLMTLKEIDSENPVIPNYETMLNTALRRFRIKLTRWIDSLPFEIQSFMKLKIVTYDNILNNLAMLSSYNKLYELDKATLEGLKYFFGEADENRSYIGRNDDKLLYLIDRFQNQTNSLKPKSEEEE